jgi:hypothetical protein
MCNTLVSGTYLPARLGEQVEWRLSSRRKFFDGHVVMGSTSLVTHLSPATLKQTPGQRNAEFGGKMSTDATRFRARTDRACPDRGRSTSSAVWGSSPGCCVVLPRLIRCAVSDVTHFSHEVSGRGERLGGFGEEGPEDMEHVCVGRIQVEASVDSVVERPIDDGFGFGPRSILGPALH